MSQRLALPTGPQSIRRATSAQFWVFAKKSGFSTSEIRIRNQLIANWFKTEELCLGVVRRLQTNRTKRGQLAIHVLLQIYMYRR